MKEQSVNAVRKSGGKLFHAAGPATLNARNNSFVNIPLPPDQHHMVAGYIDHDDDYYYKKSQELKCDTGFLGT